MNKKRKSLIIILSLTLLLSMIPFTNAAAATETRLISSSSQGALFYRQITSSTTSKVIPVYSTQVLHTQGSSTSISISDNVSSSTSASVSLTAGVSYAFTEMSYSMGVCNTATYTGPGTTYNIASSTPSGRYRIERVFPRASVKQQKVLSDSSGETIQWQRTISYAPRTNGAYQQLKRYANP